MKKCSKCGETKSLDAFTIDRANKNGVRSACKTCAAKTYQEWKRRDPNHAQKLWRKASSKYGRTKYGFTEAELADLKERQGGKCAICRVLEVDVIGRNPGILQIDHDHSTGVVRGFLCQRCNTGLGLFKDDADRLTVAANYIRAGGWSVSGPVS